MVEEEEAENLFHRGSACRLREGDVRAVGVGNGGHRVVKLTLGGIELASVVILRRSDRGENIGCTVASRGNAARRIR